MRTARVMFNIDRPDEAVKYDLRRWEDGFIVFQTRPPQGGYHTVASVNTLNVAAIIWDIKK